MVTGVMKNTKAVSMRKSPPFWQFAMAVGGMTAGVLLMLAGLILWGFSAVESVNRDYLELVLLAAAFVFLGIGAHGLDLVRSAEIKERKRRLNL